MKVCILSEGVQNRPVNRTVQNRVKHIRDSIKINYFCIRDKSFYVNISDGISPFSSKLTNFQIGEISFIYHVHRRSINCITQKNVASLSACNVIIDRKRHVDNTKLKIREQRSIRAVRRKGQVYLILKLEPCQHLINYVHHAADRIAVFIRVTKRKIIIKITNYNIGMAAEPFYFIILKSCTD